MKLSVILAAAGLAVGALGASSAIADPHGPPPGHGGPHGGPGFHGGPHGPPRHFYHHRHCRTFWHHHHRVTRCY